MTPRQVRIDSMLLPRGLPYARQTKITTKLAKFICQDMRPVNLLYGTGFQALMRELEPRYQIPCPRTMAGEIAKLYDSTKAELMEILHGQKIALTTDGWSSLATEAYVTVTAHFITTDWELRSVVLDTAELQASHTAANVAACIGTIMQNFDIRESVLAVTTDNAQNYINAVRLLQLPNITCMAHTLNLAARKGLGQRSVATALRQRRNILKHQPQTVTFWSQNKNFSA